MIESGAFPIVAVLWRDAHQSDDETELREDYICETVGWMLPREPEDDPFVRVAQEWTPDGWKAITAIPFESCLGFLVLRRAGVAVGLA